MNTLPWSRPRHEVLLLVLVGVAALTPVYLVSAQDSSRLCLTRALAEGRLTIAPCVGHAFDQARFDGRTYSDKAPGMSVLALPAASAVGLRPPAEWRWDRDLRVWAVRVLTSGLAFLVLTLAVGRVCEGLHPGTGGLALVTFALGTMVGALAATTFGHVTAAALCFVSFLLLWRRRHLVGGVAVGLALTVEYQTGIAVAILGLYAAVAGRRALLRYAIGVVPGCVLVAAYDWAAFGSPFHLSYRYVANKYALEQSKGLFGVALPRWSSTEHVLAGDRGLLVASPVVLVSLLGLALLARRRPAEALTCTGIFLGFLVLSAGYFLPYGGVSPGPRFLVPSLPFLAIGLAAALARLPRVSALLAASSLVASLALELTWARAGLAGYRQTVWGEIARLVGGAHSRLHANLASNVATVVGLSRAEAALLVVGCALAALAVALAGLGSAPRHDAA